MTLRQTLLRPTYEATLGEMSESLTCSVTRCFGSGSGNPPVNVRALAAMNALRAMLGGHAGGARSVDLRPARFFDLSDRKNALSETMNGPFTRGFQPMLNLAHIGKRLSVEPIPPAQDIME